MGDLVQKLKALCGRLDPDAECANRTDFRCTTCEAADEIARLRKPCIWQYDGGHEHYATACGHAWYFVDGDVRENNAVYCPFCGGAIVESVSPRGANNE